MVFARADGKPVDKAKLASTVREEVAEVVRMQVECGIDSVNDGEVSKTNFTNYVRERLSGFVVRTGGGGPPPLNIAGRDIVKFPEYFEEKKAGLFGGSPTGRGPSRPQVVCVEDLKFVGREALKEDI